MRGALDKMTSVIVYRDSRGRFESAAPGREPRYEDWDFKIRKPPPEPEGENWLVIASTQGDSPPKRKPKRWKRMSEKSRRMWRKRFSRVSQWEARVKAKNAGEAIAKAKKLISRRIDGSPEQRLWDWGNDKKRLKFGVMSTKEKPTDHIVFRKMKAGTKKPYSKVH